MVAVVQEGFVCSNATETYGAGIDTTLFYVTVLILQVLHTTRTVQPVTNFIDVAMYVLWLLLMQKRK